MMTGQETLRLRETESGGRGEGNGDGGENSGTDISRKAKRVNKINKV